jgi:hypothetical protein
MVRYNASDDEVWRRTSGSAYWLKDLWILPIHRPRPVEHWVLCVISPHTRELLLFDSFAECRLWKREIKVRPKSLFPISPFIFVIGNHAIGCTDGLTCQQERPPSPGGHR